MKINAAGLVRAVGRGVTDLAEGDHVVAVFVPSCGHCAPCAEGRPALCEPGAQANNAGTLVGGGHRLHRADGTPVNHHLGVSAFADHAVVSRDSLIRIDPRLPFRHAALFGCAVLTGVGAAINSAGIRAGLTVTGGLAHPERKVAIQQVSLVAEERTLRGSYEGSCVPVRDVGRYVALFQQGRLPIDRLLSRVLTLEDINDGFERLAAGQAVRQVVEFE